MNFKVYLFLVLTNLSLTFTLSLALSPAGFNNQKFRVGVANVSPKIKPEDIERRCKNFANYKCKGVKEVVLPQCWKSNFKRCVNSLQKAASSNGRHSHGTDPLREDCMKVQKEEMICLLSNGHEVCFIVQYQSYVC